MQRPSFSIYDASAGSGKTYALVKEYLKIILVSKKNDAYRNILAITFTNKAVHEMKSRIVWNLSEFAEKIPDPKAAELMDILSNGRRKKDNPQEWQDEPIGLSIIQIQTKAQQIIKHIIHNYAAFDISTIDKFTHKVIRAFAHDLNLPMTFEVTLDTENLLTEAVDAIIAQAGEDDVLTKLLIDFTMQKTDEDKSWDISREILDTGRLLLNENNREEITHFQDKSISEFIEIKNKVAEACQVINKENSELAKSLLALIEKNGIDIKSFSAGHFPNHLNNIAVEKFNPNNKTYHEFDDIKINKTAKDKLEIEAIIPELLSVLETIYTKFEKREFYNAFLKNITPLSLLNTVSNELAKIQKEQNLLSIAEFNAIIYNEIQNQPAPFIYERLGERYRHFFIDEFQDTSEMQWQNLIPLIDNATSSEIEGEKGTLMIVGDPKQSIYRWRGGKAEQFIELSKGKNPFNNPDKQLFTLDTNYRSYSQVIDFNNKFFYYLSTEFNNADYKDLYENHSRQEENSKKGGYVNISFLPKMENTSEEEESLDKIEMYLKATLKTIEKVKNEGFDYQEIVILTRKRAQGIALANYLIENNIPIISSETLMIKNSTDVQMIINVLRYLHNNSDIKAKAGFLLYIANQFQTNMAVHDFIAKGKEKVKENEFELWLSEFDISLSFQDIRKKSLYEAVEIIVSKFLSPTLSKGKGDITENHADEKGQKLGYLTGGKYSHLSIEKAQEMRKKPTDAEKILWSELKSKSLEYKFRQQHLVNDFIVDFVCLSKKLIIEVDGEYHFTEEQIQLDADRTRILNELGYKLIRFKNEEVTGTISTVLDKIKSELKNQEKEQHFDLSVSSPSPSGRVGAGNAYVQYFIDIVLERDIRNQAGIADFLSYWDKNNDKFSIPSPEGKNAIRIMTIHKSKGLEFPVVIMPFADEDYVRKPKDKLWLDAEEETFGLPKVLIDNSSSVENFGEEAAAVFHEKKQEELLDNINVLYVALTRAEEQLYVISQYLEPNKEGQYPYNTASFFIEYLIAIEVYNPSILEYEFGNKVKLSKVISFNDETNTIPTISSVLDPKDIKIARREALMWGTNQQKAIEYGNIIHEILSFVKTASDIDLAIQNAIENGLITLNQKEVVLKSIQEIVNNKELESYFSSGNEILNEQAIIQKEGKTIKPDRMVLTKNKEVYLLDYKTGTHNQKYQLQLENYQNAIEKMGLKVTKKALVYIGEEINVVNL
jgi:ATP-dependent exoDNAse (exonuclease V) beta subunit